MEETKGVAPEGATLTEGATDIAPQEGAEAPKVVPVEEYERVKQELDNVQKEFDHIKKSQQGSDKMVGILQQELSKTQAEMNDLQQKSINQKLNILAKERAGTLDETQGTVEQQMAMVDANAEKQKQGIQVKADYERYIKVSLEEIREILTEGGIDPDSQTPEAIEVQKAWGEAVQAGKPLASVVAKASKIVNAKMKTSVPDMEKLKEEIRAELREEFKKSPGLKVETGGPSTSAGNDQEFLDKYGRGEIDDHKRAKQILDKIRKGG